MLGSLRSAQALAMVRAVTVDKRKQSLYFPEEMLGALQQEAERLDRSLSWVVQRCVKIGIPQLKQLPSTESPAVPEPQD